MIIRGVDYYSNIYTIKGKGEDKKEDRE